MTDHQYALARSTRVAVSIGMMLAFSYLVPAHDTQAAGWTVSPINSLQLDTSGVGFTVGEMSGVTYLGPSPSVGKHRFLTVQDTGEGIVAFDTAFDLSGNLVSAEAVSNLELSTSLDNEGIAYTGSSLFVSDEDGPGVREYDMNSGNVLQSVNIPSLFSNSLRNNLGFESLTFDAVHSNLWTANEAALTSDGQEATSSVGTTVRLLELEISGNLVSPGRQFAYQVEPIHGSASDSSRSGLVDLVSLPDGTLLALERSLANALPPLQSRIFELDFSGATDISAAPFDTGLIGQTYNEVGKELLWSGSAGGGFGQNMEGLTVGPRLPDGSWVLLGVVDDGDPVSTNTIVSILVTPTTAIPFDPESADFDLDANVDGADYLAWQRGFGVATLASPTDGDANHDGTVSSSDLSIWERQFGTASSLSHLLAVPEPSTLLLLMLAGASGFALGRRR